jgi:stage V sporulation protein AD
MREYNIPFIGTYSACSTLALNFSLASFFIDRGYFSNTIIFTGSHYNTAERQFRNPCEYGGQRKDCSTSTVTGAGAFILTNEKSKIKVGSITIGRVIDYKVKDVNDMGTAMSPSAFDTFKRHLKDLSIEPSYYDLILTGDLSRIGKNLFEKMCEAENIILNNNYNDSGLMVYDVNKQKVYSGGSGCGCIAITTGGYIVEKLLNYEYKRVLIIATGALLSPLIVYQKETIPCISHAFSLEVDS